MLDRSTPPPIKNIDSIQLLPLQKSAFSNGFPLYYISSSSDIIQLSFLFKAGWNYQTKKLLADTFASLINNGTLKHSSKEIAEQLEYYGVFVDVQPSAIYTKLQFTLLKKNLSFVLPLLEEIIKYANFPQEELDIYIRNQSEQYQTKIKNVNILAQWHYSKIIYGNNHPFNKFHLPQDYQEISRDDLLTFFNTHIHPKNGFIFISGDIDSSVIELLNQHFGKETFHQSQYTFDEVIPQPNSYEEHCIIELPDALQSAIRVGMVLPLTHQNNDYIDFVIANTLFGGYFGSRLMSVIREEKGFTYGIYSSLTTYNSFSVFTISSEVKSETTKECIDEILNQIEVLQNTPPDEEELQIVKNYLSGEILDNTDGILKQDTVWKSIITKHLSHDYYNQFLQRIKTIQAEDISKVFQKYISIPQLKKCVVGKMQ